MVVFRLVYFFLPDSEFIRDFPVQVIRLRVFAFKPHQMIKHCLESFTINQSPLFPQHITRETLNDLKLKIRFQFVFLLQTPDDMRHALYFCFDLNVYML